LLENISTSSSDESDTENDIPNLYHPSETEFDCVEDPQSEIGSISDDIDEILYNITSNNSNESDFSSSNDETDLGTSLTLKEELSGWAVKHRLTRCSINDLLKIVNDIPGVSLPKDSRTIENTVDDVERFQCSLSDIDCSL